MNFTDDEEAAIYLATAEPPKVWALLDTFSPERFARTLGAYRGMPDPRPLEHLERFEWKEQLRRDSTRPCLPGVKIGTSLLPEMPGTAKIAFLLNLLPGRGSSAVLMAFEPELSKRIQARIGQNWRLTSDARRVLMEQVGFHTELFEKFARRAPQGVAEWLVDRLFFGVVAVGRLTELSPIREVPVRTGRSAGLRKRASAGNSTSLSGDRGEHLAIVLMSLPPEVSAQLFKELGPDMVQRITLSISRLPPITPEVRMAVLEMVLEVGLEDLEALARRDPAPLAARLRDYLEEGPV